MASDENDGRSRKKAAAPPVPEKRTDGGESNPVLILNAFKEYNRRKLTFTYEHLTKLKKIAFDVIPILIQAEVPSRGKSVHPASRRGPHHIVGYTFSRRAAHAFSQAFPGRRIPKFLSSTSRQGEAPIKTVALMGSLGSVAQNNKSDFDYWICIDPHAFTDDELVLFRGKLQAIEKWAESYAGAEVHFFVMDQDSIRNNDFGEAGRESTGSAMGNLLKEEFYRSMTLVAGQIPLWWATPAGVGDAEYRLAAERIKSSPAFGGLEIVDLGNLQPLSPGEFHGAAIWQISKTIGSPFKSVLKIALLEEYIMTRGQKGLLADELKSRLIPGIDQGRYLDPYLLMFDRATRYLEAQKRRLDLALLRQCLYLKVGETVALDDVYRRDLLLKKRIMSSLVKRWGWRADELERLNNYHFWPFEESQRFSERINGYIFRTFDAINDELAGYSETADRTITRRDLKVLKRKLFAFYSKRPKKVDSIKNVIEKPPTLSSLTIQHERDDEGAEVWSLYRGMLSRKSISRGEAVSLQLNRSKHLGEALIWLVNNRLWGNQTSVNLNPAASGMKDYCTAVDIQELLALMKDLFPPHKYRALSEQALLNDPIIERILLVVNLNEPDSADDVEDICVCYQNNWGELFFEMTEDLVEAAKLVRAFHHHHRYDLDDTWTGNLKIFLSNRISKQAILNLLSRDIDMDSHA